MIADQDAVAPEKLTSEIDDGRPSGSPLSVGAQMVGEGQVTAEVVVPPQTVFPAELS